MTGSNDVDQELNSEDEERHFWKNNDSSEYLDWSKVAAFYRSLGFIAEDRLSIGALIR